MTGQDVVGNIASYNVIGMSSGMLNEIKLSLAIYKAKCLINVPKRQAIKQAKIAKVNCLVNISKWQTNKTGQNG